MTIICSQKPVRNISFLVLSRKNNILQALRSEGSFRNFLARHRCIELCFAGDFHFILSSKIHPRVKMRIGKHSQHVERSSELLRANLLTNYRMPITQTTPPSLPSMNWVRVAQGTGTYVTHPQHEQQPGLSAVLRIKKADGVHTHITCQIPLCLSCQEWQSIQTKHKSFFLLLLPATPVEFLKRWQQHGFFITINPFYLFYSHSENSQVMSPSYTLCPESIWLRIRSWCLLLHPVTGYCGYCNPCISLVPVKLPVCRSPGSMWKMHSFKL